MIICETLLYEHLAMIGLMLVVLMVNLALWREVANGANGKPYKETCE